jgi:multidrug efflux system membrane fusion protein
MNNTRKRALAHRDSGAGGTRPGRWAGLSGAMVLLVMLTACQQGNAPEQAGAAPPPPAVSVAAAVEREVAEWDEFTGRLEAVESVEVRPRVAGQIERVAFRHGAEVKKGDLLFVIDPRPFRAEHDRAQAEATRAHTQLDLARVQIARIQKLVGEGGVSKQEFDERASAVKQGEAALGLAQAALESARLNVEFTEVRAPISGRAGRAEVTAGNLVAAGTTMLTTIVSLDPVHLYFEGDEQVYLKFQALARSGERPSSRETRSTVFVGLANEEGHPHKGYVDFVDNRLDVRTGTIRVRAVLSNKDRVFTPGLFARVKLIGSGTYRAVLISDRAVGTDQSQKFVLALGPDNKVQYRPVRLGPLVDGLRVVKEGLKADEVIVVNGLQRVRPGMPVTPTTVPMEGPAPGSAAAPSAEPAKGK